jgi:hypothetical protein
MARLGETLPHNDPPFEIATMNDAPARPRPTRPPTLLREVLLRCVTALNVASRADRDPG